MKIWMVSRSEQTIATYWWFIRHLMVLPIRAWLGLIQYEKALLWLWGHCPPTLLVGGGGSFPPFLYLWSVLPVTNRLLPGLVMVHVVKISGASRLLTEHCPICSTIGLFPRSSASWAPLILCGIFIQNRLIYLSLHFQHTGGFHPVTRGALPLWLTGLCLPLGLLTRCWTALSRH